MEGFYKEVFKVTSGNQLEELINLLSQIKRKELSND